MAHLFGGPFLSQRSLTSVPQLPWRIVKADDVLTCGLEVAPQIKNTELVKERTGWSENEIADRVEAYIVTKGSEGSYIHTATDEIIAIPVVKPAALCDPTGCGDAYRAGLLYGLENGLDWITTGRIATLMGTYKIESEGTQNHSFNLAEFRKRFEAEYDASF